MPNFMRKIKSTPTPVNYRRRIGATCTVEGLDGSFRIESKSGRSGFFNVSPQTGQRLTILELWELGFRCESSQGYAYSIEVPAKAVTV